MVNFVDDAVSDETDINVDNDNFYPDLSLSELAKSYRIVDEVSSDVTAQQLQSAIYHINDQLNTWRQSRTETSLDDMGQSFVWQYKNAVYTQTKAYLIRIYRDASATSLGHDRADGNDISADDYEKQSWQSLQKLLGKSTTRITLL